VALRVAHPECNLLLAAVAATAAAAAAAAVTAQLNHKKGDMFYHVAVAEACALLCQDTSTRCGERIQEVFVGFNL
jgi:hypothetical protein